jgi:hypothetical protein
MEITIQDEPECVEGIHGNAYDFPGITMNESGAWINRRGADLLELKQGDYLTSFPGPNGEIVFFCKTDDGTGYKATPANGQSGASVHSALICAHEDIDPAEAYEFRRTDFEHPKWDSPVFAALPRQK